MAANIEWSHDGRVMLITYTGYISTLMIKQVLSEFVEACNRSTTHIHTISDTRHMIGIPSNILGIMQMHPHPLQHPRAGTHIVVIANGLLQLVVQKLAWMVPGSRFYCTRTVEEAWSILNDKGI